ncbi:MAG: PIN domain-containing protein [Deltaproteobacteria bacterium]|nr:PIN domain-containing protein [Deltaproteobacteria bacterium]
MTVLIDTPIWSLALRRNPKHLNPEEERLVHEWAGLVRTGQASLIGAIRQELLSGVRHRADFVRLQDHLTTFEDLPLLTSDYEQAAMFFNRCQAKGVTGTPIDLQICAVASRLALGIFTTDDDFEDYARCLPIRRHLMPVENR